MKTELRNQIESLTPSEKTRLLDVVWASLEADAVLLTEEQRAELDRRSERLHKNPDNVIPWEQVKADLFEES